MTYKSKFGFVPFFIVMLFAITIIAISLSHKEGIGISVGLLLMVLYLYSFFTTNYTINDSDLVISISFLTLRRIPINKISRIKKTTNLLSSPAFSINRIYVFYKDIGENENFVLISPNKEKDFVLELVKINGDIVYW